MDKKIYDIDEMLKKIATMSNTSAGGSVCYDFGDVVLVKYTLPAEYHKLAREEAEKVKEILDKLYDDGVPNICRYLQIKREVVGDKSICWVLQEKAKGTPCTEFYKMDSVEDKVLGDIANYPNLKYLGKNPHLVYGVPSEHIKDMLYSTYRLLDAKLSLEPKRKNVFYNPEQDGGYTHIDFLYDPDFLDELLPWEKLSYIMMYANITLTTPLPEWVSPEIRQKMSKDLQMSAYEVLPDYPKYARWIEKKIPEDYIEMQEYIDGLKKMRSAEIKRDAELVIQGKKMIINCRPSTILQKNIELIPPKNIDISLIDEDNIESQYEYARNQAFTKEMQAEIMEQVAMQQQAINSKLK